MSKLQRHKKEVVKTYPNYSSNPENEHHSLFGKYQLLKYKPWKFTPDDAWNGLPENVTLHGKTGIKVIACSQHLTQHA